MFSVVGYGSLELGHLVVKVAMIVDSHHFVFDHVFQPFQIDDEAADRIDVACNSDLDGVIVAVPVTVGAATEDSFILLLAPLGFPIVVSRRKCRTRA